MLLKRTTILILCLILTILLSSCTFPAEYVKRSDNAKKIEAVMDLIEDENADELIKHFSPYLRNNYNDELIIEINDMFSYIDGKIISRDDVKSTGYTQQSVDYGDIKLYTSNPKIKNVETEGGQILTFIFSYSVIDDKNPERIGINQIRIYTQEDDGDLEELQVNVDGELEDDN